MSVTLICDECHKTINPGDYACCHDCWRKEHNKAAFTDDAELYGWVKLSPEAFKDSLSEAEFTLERELAAFKVTLLKELREHYEKTHSAGTPHQLRPASNRKNSKGRALVADSADEKKTYFERVREGAEGVDSPKRK